MDLHHLRIFVTVAEAQNLTKGARRLYMTPPAVSAQIKALEDELGLKLFVRTSKGMTLTEPGRHLKTKAEQTLLAAQAFINDATAMQSELMGRLRIGLNATPAFLRVAALAQQMQGIYPGIELELVASSTGVILDDLDAGKLDAGYIFGPSPSDAIVTQPLGMVEVVIAAPPQWHDLIVRADWPDLARLPWIGGDGYCPFETLTDDLFRQRQLTYRLAAHSQDEATKVELVAAGIGLAVLERSEAELARQSGRLIIWDSEPMHCMLNAACSARRQDDPLIQAMWTIVLEIWGAEDASTCVDPAADYI